MTTYSKHYAPAALVTLFALAATPCSAQVVGAIGTVMRGKNIFEFYETAIANPQEIIVLSSEIKGLFHGSSIRYKDLNNDLAQKLGLFEAGPIGLDHIELRSEPSPNSAHGYYSITLKKLTFKQCTALSNHRALSLSFIRVDLNGKAISLNGVQQIGIPPCISQWFFQDGNNTLKYIAY